MNESYVLLATFQSLLVLALPLLFLHQFCPFYKFLYRSTHSSFTPALYLVYIGSLCLLSHNKQGAHFFTDVFYFLLSQERQISCLATVGAVCSGTLTAFATINTIVTYLLASSKDRGSFGEANSRKSRAAG